MTYQSLITCEQLAAHVEDPGWVIFDCRFSLHDPAMGAQAYRFGHIANARYADLEKDLSGQVTALTGRHPLPNLALLSKKLGHWGVANSKQVVLYDDAGGVFASRFWWLFRLLGHDPVAVLNGGLDEWKRQRRALTTAIPIVRPASFRAYYDDTSLVTALQLENLLAAKSIRLIDARVAERFTGQVEPLDTVAGHVPGAVNHPFTDNLDANKCFLPKVKLSEQFRSLLAETPSEQVVHMCGSGVTACHNMLAMEYCQLRGSRLYAGSWSEWIRDPNRPVSSEN